MPCDNVRRLAWLRSRVTGYSVTPGRVNDRRNGVALRLRLTIVGFAIAQLAAIPAAPAQTGVPANANSPLSVMPRYRLRLLGVFDASSGDPIEGAEVEDIMSGVSARTTTTGTVSLFYVPEGTTLLRIRKIGYGVQLIPISISPADASPLTIVLSPAHELPTVITRGSAPRYLSPALRGFEARRAAGMTGYFISEAELRKNDGRALADLLKSKVPGVNIQYSGHATNLMKSPRCVDGGPPDVYLDGVPVARTPESGTPGQSVRQRNSRSSSNIPPIDLSAFDVSDLAGVEYYPDGATMPIEFNHTTQGCGALLLWTRER